VERLRAQLPTDPLSEVLLPVRVRSSLYCRSEFSAPWGFAVEARPSATFHLVLAGQGWLEVADGSEARALMPGDLVLLPRGHAHQLRDRLGSSAPLLTELLTLHPPKNGLLRHGGGGAQTDILCGRYTLESPGPVPLLAALPSVVHLQAADPENRDWLPAMISLLRREVQSDAPGTDAVIVRLSEVLITQALRQCLLRLDDWSPNGSGALKDDKIARALRLIREYPGRNWTVAELASAVAMSRSAFADRFQELTSRSPMRFLSDYRLARAAQYLRATPATLTEIARDTGYESDASLSRAFKRAFGMAPGAYRKTPEPAAGR
jgi:AraC-like DNA-binding protein